ncbi:hypothetical protein AHAS_Ahas13G0227700 [Arachis hypogaea]
MSHFQEQPCLGKYLGALISNHRSGKDKFKHVLERVNDKLKESEENPPCKLEHLLLPKKTRRSWILKASCYERYFLAEANMEDLYRTTSFMGHDNWHNDLKSLHDVLTKPIPEELEYKAVSAYVTESVASTYKHLTQKSRETTENWKEIWKWRGPERTKVFLWQVTHDRIFTAKRRARLMGTPPYCHRCPNQEESTLHVLRDCPCAALVWNKLVQPSILATFFTVDFKSWLNLNLTNAIGYGSSTAWTDIFMTTCWQAICGGLIRTSEGEWVGGFRANLDYCQATQAELWGVHYGLQTTWSLGMRRVIVELDSPNAIMYIKRNPSDSYGHSHLIRKIAEWMKQPWEIIFRHVYREANRSSELAY